MGRMPSCFKPQHINSSHLGYYYLSLELNVHKVINNVVYNLNTVITIAVLKSIKNSILVLVN